MSQIDSLEIQIQSKADSVNSSLDNVVKKLGLIAEGINAISNGGGLGKFAKEAREATKGFANISNVAKGMTADIKPQMQDATKTLGDLTKKYKDLGKGFKFTGSTATIQKQIDKLSNSLETAKLRKEELEAGGKISGKGYEDSIKNVLKYSNMIESLNQQLSEMQETKLPLDFKITGVEEAKQAVESLNESITKIKDIPVKDFNYNAEAMKAVFGEAAGEIENWGQAVEKFGRNAGKILNEDTQLDFKITGVEEAKQAVESLKDSIGTTGQATTIFRGKVEKVLNSILNIGRISKEAVHTGGESFKKLGGLIKGITSKALKLKNGIMDLQKQSGKGLSLGGMIGTSILFSSVFQAIGAVKQAIKEGSDNLVQYSMTYNNSISSMVSSLTMLKNAFASAFSPILNVVAPYITSFINMISTAANKTGQFFAALTGKSMAVQAVPVVQDYAAGLDKAIGGTDKLNDSSKKLKKTLSVLGFDALNQLQGQNDSGDSAGLSGGTSAGGGLSAQDMFKTVPVENEISKFAEKIKEAWANADFTELGSIIGTKIKTALDSIGWNLIKETAAKTGKSIGTLINGFVEVDGFGYSIGKTIGEAINTGIAGTNAFLDNTHWDSIGKFFAEGLNGIIGNVDWEGIGHNLVAKLRAVIITAINFFGNIDFGSISSGLSDFAIGIFNSLSYLIAEIEWSKLPGWIIDSISDFFSNFKYAEIFGSVGELIANAIIAGIDLLTGIGESLSNAWDNVVNYFKSYIEDSGGDIIQGLWNGISNALSSVGEWIHKNILEPFVNGFKKAFGIHSPSTVMKEMGTYLMQGLFEGISSLVDWVVSIFKKIKDKIVEIWNTVKEKTSSVWNGIKNTVSGIWDGIKNTASNVFNGIKNTIVNVWDNLKSATSRVWQGIVSVIKSPINAIIGLANGLLSGMASAVNGIANMLNNLRVDIPDWVPGIGGGTLGFNIPTWRVGRIPYLYNGGVLEKGQVGILEGNGAEAVVPLEKNRQWISKVSEEMMKSNHEYSGGIDEAVLTNAIAQGFAMAMMNNRNNLSQNSHQPINITVKLENDEAIARAAIRGQQSIDYRMNPTPQFG